SASDPLVDVDLLTRRELHQRLLVPGAASDGAADAPPLPRVVRGPDVDDPHTEELLDGVADLDLVRVPRHDERVGPAVLRIRLRQVGGPFRDHRPEDHLPWITHSPPPPPHARAPRPRSRPYRTTARRRRTPRRTAGPRRPGCSGPTGRRAADARPSAAAHCPRRRRPLGAR